MSRKSLSVREKEIIIGNYMENNSFAETARIVGRCRSVVCRVVKRFNEENSLCEKPKSGRPVKTTKREDRTIVKFATKDRFLSARKIANKFNMETGNTISYATVIRRLEKAGLHARIPARKPLISLKNRRKRLQFAKEHHVWNQAKWNSVFFSDESKFNLFGNDGKKYVWRKPGERLSVQCTKKTVKFGGGSVMVWGMMSSAGVGPLIRIQGTVNAEVYKQILIQHAIPTLQTVPNSMFMQDNAPCHKAKKIMDFLNGESISVMDWPAQSPDLNPIENLWKVMGEKAMEKNPKDTDSLWNELQNAWENIDPSLCKKLINSCGRRCAAVIAQKGLHTKY